MGNWEEHSYLLSLVSSWLISFTRSLMLNSHPSKYLSKMTGRADIISEADRSFQTVAPPSSPAIVWCATAGSQII